MIGKISSLQHRRAILLALLAAAAATPAFAQNIAPQGIGLIGVNDAIDADAGTPRANAGSAANVNDGNQTSRVDTYFPGNSSPNSFVGVRWLTKRYENIQTLGFRIAAFGDGGWFGPNTVTPGNGQPLRAEHLTEPTVQVTRDGGVTWETVPFTSNYIATMTGHVIGTPNPNPADIAFTLTEPVSGIDGIRLIGPNGGPADGNGFLGVFELSVDATPGADTDSDGMADAYERAYSLNVGANDAELDPDSDGLNNLGEHNSNTNPNLADTDNDGLDDSQEVTVALTNPNLADTDNDGLLDGAEANTHFTDPLDADSDNDTLSDGAEVNTHRTEPTEPDTDFDGFNDNVEIAQGSDAKDPASVPDNFAAAALGGIALQGVKNGLEGPETELYHAGARGNINDGLLNTTSDTWNGDQAANATWTHSFVGATWATPVPVAIEKVELTHATFGDGGWFGVNARSPGPGLPLTEAHLAAPELQIKTASNADWTSVPYTSDYAQKMLGHRIGVFGQPPTQVKVTFTLNSPVSELTGIRLVGTDGGTASGGFIGVADFAVRPASGDLDNDGLPDTWERQNGLDVGTNDAALDRDNDGLTNAQEFARETNPQAADSDGDGLNDGPEVATHNTNPARADTDADGLSDGAEINTHRSNPNNVDSDSDGFRDGVEVAQGSDPASASSKPTNLALAGSGILGVKPSMDDPAQTLVFNAGGQASINDGNVRTVVDSFNLDANTVSFVGILWPSIRTESITSIKFHNATFFDGGWFGVNGTGPGANGRLGADYLREPTLQITTDGGATWTTVPHTSDYLTAGQDHLLPAAFGAPTTLTATFTPNAPITGVNGIRLIGTEGGNAAASANGGFLGVYEFEVNTTTGGGGGEGVRILNPARAAGQFSLQFQTETGKSYQLQFRNSLTAGDWETLRTVTGDGTLKTETDATDLPMRFYRVITNP